MRSSLSQALGFVADKDILERICYDFSDAQMMELLHPSLEEAFVIQNQQDLSGKLQLVKESKIRKFQANPFLQLFRPISKSINLPFFSGNNLLQLFQSVKFILLWICRSFKGPTVGLYSKENNTVEDVDVLSWQVVIVYVEGMVGGRKGEGFIFSCYSAGQENRDDSLSSFWSGRGSDSSTSLAH
ncbi:hypothetical protein RJT34_20383 [Clitoria ternatea]|uniref:RNA polymerase Rpb2 domain-containing protein n=1 Tax=Clitoria ternatea TaxID=43366 RepID=A0AAN9IST8_CLITE